jgi:hypothetical protein
MHAQQLHHIRLLQVHIGSFSKELFQEKSVENSTSKKKPAHTHVKLLAKLGRFRNLSKKHKKASMKCNHDYESNSHHFN